MSYQYKCVILLFSIELILY